MDSLVGALIKASKAYANPMAAEYASGNRVYEVQVERPGERPEFDRVSGEFVNTPDAILYVGPARIYPAQGGTELEIGDERIPFAAATITLDYFTTATMSDPTATPKVDDVVRVLETPQSRSTHLAGRTFEVTGVEVGGHYGIGWTLQTLGAGPSRHGG